MVNKKIEPLRRGDFGAAQHRYSIYDAEVSGKLSKSDLTNPALWVNVSSGVIPGDEIRVRADDDSFVAQLYVTYVMGTILKAHLISFAKLEAVSHGADDPSSPYFVESRGRKKWCVIERSTGFIVKEMISSQAEAYRDLSDHIKALAA